MRRRLAPHGTVTRYSVHRCRCTKCRKAQREYMRALRAKLRSPEMEAEIPHGTVNGYENYGCRCERCTKAKMKSKRAARKRVAA
jgi:hypothetical protein